jgi:hypothetical protein
MLRLIRKLAGIEDGPRLDIMKDILMVKMLNHPCISVLVRLPRFSVPLESSRILHRRAAYLYDANQHQRLHQTSSVCSTTLTTQYPYQTQPPHIFTARVRYVSQTMNQTQTYRTTVVDGHAWPSIETTPSSLDLWLKRQSRLLIHDRD